MGETPCSQTISPKLQRIADQGQQQLCAKRGRRPCLVHRGLRPAATEEPDALIRHVRVCGGSGG
jgi:hypothetical protein